MKRGKRTNRAVKQKNHIKLYGGIAFGLIVFFVVSFLPIFPIQTESSTSLSSLKTVNLWQYVGLAPLTYQYKTNLVSSPGTYVTITGTPSPTPTPTVTLTPTPSPTQTVTPVPMCTDDSSCPSKCCYKGVCSELSTCYECTDYDPNCFKCPETPTTDDPDCIISDLSGTISTTPVDSQNSLCDPITPTPADCNTNSLILTGNAVLTGDATAGGGNKCAVKCFEYSHPKTCPICVDWEPAVTDSGIPIQIIDTDQSGPVGPIPLFICGYFDENGKFQETSRQVQGIPSIQRLLDMYNGAVAALKAYKPCNIKPKKPDEFYEKAVSGCAGAKGTFHIDVPKDGDETTATITLDDGIVLIGKGEDGQVKERAGTVPIIIHPEPDRYNTFTFGITIPSPPGSYTKTIVIQYRDLKITITIKITSEDCSIKTPKCTSNGLCKTDTDCAKFEKKDCWGDDITREIWVCRPVVIDYTTKPFKLSTDKYCQNSFATIIVTQCPTGQTCDPNTKTCVPKTTKTPPKTQCVDKRNGIMDLSDLPKAL